MSNYMFQPDDSIRIEAASINGDKNKELSPLVHNFNFSPGDRFFSFGAFIITSYNKDFLIFYGGNHDYTLGDTYISKIVSICNYGADRVYVLCEHALYTLIYKQSKSKGCKYEFSFERTCITETDDCDNHDYVGIVKIAEHHSTDRTVTSFAVFENNGMIRRFDTIRTVIGRDEYSIESYEVSEVYKSYGCIGLRSLLHSVQCWGNNIVCMSTTKTARVLKFSHGSINILEPCNDTKHDNVSVECAVYNNGFTLAKISDNDVRLYHDLRKDTHIAKLQLRDTSKVKVFSIGDCVGIVSVVNSKLMATVCRCEYQNGKYTLRRRNFELFGHHVDDVFIDDHDGNLTIFVFKDNKVCHGSFLLSIKN